ncbi:hypothetical protein EC917_101365 [Bacillus thuringiensis]|uniref:Uncharacterized protein n=1 Tax=Bacillus thuringiensis TaxID=1428 RepID=A0A4R4BLW8_BACTU|nr:hypothetical protein EC917_101365 [Bacillus thuringiensis]TCW59649.1 hypothetical protein EC910_101279 [Bacillus thuringiensis]
MATLFIIEKRNDNMTKEEFEEGYCKCSDITLEEYNESFVTLPCKCKETSCNGWAVVINSPLSIKVHKEIYS